MIVVLVEGNEEGFKGEEASINSVMPALHSRCIVSPPILK